MLIYFFNKPEKEVDYGYKNFWNILRNKCSYRKAEHLGLVSTNLMYLFDFIIVCPSFLWENIQLKGFFTDHILREQLC